MFKKYFTIFDFPFLYCELEDDFKDKFFNSATKKAGGMGRLSSYIAISQKDRRVYPKLLFHYKRDPPVPSWVLAELQVLNQTSIRRVERSIISYYTNKSKSRIYPGFDKGRKHLVEHDVYLDHFCGLLNSTSSRENTHILKERIGMRAAEVGHKVFGEFDITFNHAGSRRDNVQVFLPVILAHMMDYCHSFPTLDEPKKNLLAYAAAVTENIGSPSSTEIILEQNDRPFLRNVESLLGELGIQSKLTPTPSTYRLSLGKSNTSMLVKMVENKLPEDLQFSPEKQRVLYQRLFRPVRTDLSRGEIDELVIEGLKEQNMTADELGIKKNITAQSARKALHRLEDEGVALRVGKKKICKRPADIWGLRQ